MLLTKTLKKNQRNKYYVWKIKTKSIKQVLSNTYGNSLITQILETNLCAINLNLNFKVGKIIMTF